MSDHPKVYVIRPGKLREQDMRWLAELNDHITTEKPIEGFKPGGVLPDK